MAKSRFRDRSMKSLNISDLSDELLEEILHRLQCPSTVRCKSVSKRWYALISSPDFIHGLICHHHRLSQVQKQHNSHVLFSHAESLLDPKAPTLEAEPIIRKFLLGFLKDYRVLGESNGWLCCTKRHDPTNVYYICNPLTNYWLELPPAPSTSRALSLGFLCDPYYHIDEETHAVTLNSKCRFVVVRFTRITYGYELKRVEVFSSSTGKWSELSLSCSEWFPLTGKNVVAFNGKLHFLGHERILSFDPFKNVETCITSQCHFIDIPEHVYPWDLLITSSGSLGIIEISREVHIWELKDYKKETWCLQEKKHIENIEQNLREAYPILPTCDILTMLSSIAAAHTKVVFCHYDYNLACYKLHEEAFISPTLGKPFTYYLWIKVFPMVLPWWHGHFVGLDPSQGALKMNHGWDVDLVVEG